MNIPPLLSIPILVPHCILFGYCSKYSKYRASCTTPAFLEQIPHVQGYRTSLLKALLCLAPYTTPLNDFPLPVELRTHSLFCLRFLALHNTSQATF